MVKILHVGNGNEKHRGARFYDVGRKLQHGLIRNNHNALFFSDRDVTRTSGIMGTKWQGAKKCNERLLDTVRNFKPDMVLLGHADLITNDTLQEMRQQHPRLRIAQFNVDPIFRPENDAAIRHRIPHLDASFITTGGDILQRYATPHHCVAYIPNPIDPALESHRAHEHSNAPYDVFYAVRATTTTGSQEGNDRLIIPRYLRDSVEHVRCHFFGFDGAAELFGAGFYDAIGEASMGLNLSHKQTTKGSVIVASDAERFLYSSDRISQYLGCGLLTFTERGFAQEQLFTEDEIVFFENKEELAEKLQYFLTHPSDRQRIAHNGWLKAHCNMNATLIAQFIVEVTMGQSFSHPYQWVESGGVYSDACL